MITSHRPPFREYHVGPAYCKSVCQWGPHHYSTIAHWGRRTPKTVVCVLTPQRVMSTHHPALHPWEGTCTRATESRPVGGMRLSPSCVQIQSLETFLSVQMTVCTYPLYTVIPFQSLEASDWYDSAEKKKKKKVRIITIEDSSYSPLAGSQCCVWMCRERFQRAPFTIWHFQRMFQPSEGHLFKVCVSLEQNRCPLGKTDTSEEQEWKEQKGKKAKKRSGERRVFPFC